MFSKINAYMIYVTDDTEISHVMKLASRYNIMTKHTIAIYEEEQQHELICKGRWIDMYRFDKELNKKNATKK